MLSFLLQTSLLKVEYIKKGEQRMIPAFNNITEDGFLLLKEILEYPNLVPADMFFFEPTVDGQLELLLSSKLVSMNESAELNITELGRAALKEYEHEQERQLFLKQQREEELASFKIIAESAKESANYAKQQAESAHSVSISASKSASYAYSIAESAKNESQLAINLSKKADIKGWLSVILAALALIFEYAVNYQEINALPSKILDFLSSIGK